MELSIPRYNRAGTRRFIGSAVLAMIFGTLFSTSCFALLSILQIVPGYPGTDFIDCASSKLECLQHDNNNTLLCNYPGTNFCTDTGTLADNTVVISQNAMVLQFVRCTGSS